MPYKSPKTPNASKKPNSNSFTDSRFSIIRFLTTLSYRDHRKIVVIDGKVGYTGGMNINDKYFHLWRDTHLRLEGSAVAHLQYAFLDTWLNCGGNVPEPLTNYFPMLNNTDTDQSVEPLMQIATGDPTSPIAVMQISYEWILTHAKHYVYLQTPYLSPPQSLLRAIRAATASGVEVIIMLPEVCDTAIMRPINQSYYKECIEAGATILLRKGVFMHSKTLLADDYLTCIGSLNLDYRSFDMDYEINAYIYNKEIATHCKHIFNQDRQHCYPLNPTISTTPSSDPSSTPSYPQSPWYTQVFRRILHLLAPIV